VDDGAARPVDLGVEEVLPEGDRVGVLLAVRLAMAGIVMAVASLAAGGIDVLLLAAGYVLLVVLVELVRRQGVVVGSFVPRSLLLVDGAFLAVAVARTGGVGSPVEALFFLHVVAVVLTSDRQTGIEASAWDAGMLGGVWLFGSAAQPGGPAVVELMLQLAVLLLVAAVASGVVALHQRVLEAEVRKLVDRDPLTGLANRRGLDQALRQEVARAGRTGGELSVAMVDVDHFKSVNDTDGHQVGDAVLRVVAEALRAGVREYDVAARLGGDEFVLVLPGCGPDEAVAVAERLRQSIGTATADTHQVTASAGVAVFAVHGTEPEELVAAADAALYAAKRAGRDRTAAAVARIPDTPPPEPQPS
jgi:diguanylate cyclase (GGDEF)-like protein